MKRTLFTFVLFSGLLICQSNENSLSSYNLSTRTIFSDLSALPIPLESTFDANTYIMGPGDQIHVVVVSNENPKFPGQEYDLFNSDLVEYYELVSPMGELSLPGIGQFDVSGKTYSEVKSLIISNAKESSYKNINISVRLASIRTFKIRVAGAVEAPGYVNLSAGSRLKDAIDKSNGIQKYGDNERIVLFRNGKNLDLYLKKFLIDGDLSQNPILLEGDKIYVPFHESVESIKNDISEYKESQIIVHGFVRGPRGFRYVPGYRASDYVAMVGGPLDIGAVNRLVITRSDGTIINKGYNDFVEPGDVIIVPENFRSRIFGNISFIQSATAIATLYLAYQAAISTK